MNPYIATESRIDRRKFLQRGVAAALGAALVPATSAKGGAAATLAGTEAPTLRDKFFGCIAGVHIGSAMGAPVEGWSWRKIQDEYGTLERLLPYEHYGNHWKREPGTTEDGVERQKLMITAILEKNDRVTAEDVRRIWLRDIKPESAGMVSEPFEAVLLSMANTPIPARDLGRYCDYSGLISMARACHPLGLINAGDVRGAIEDVHEVGQLYNAPESKGIRWAEVTAAGIAAATRPQASVDSVLGAIFDYCDKGNGYAVKPAGVLREVETGLKWTEGCKDFRELRQKFDEVYNGRGIPYSQSYANEVVTKAVCIFRMVKGNTWEAMTASVNMGRDTDCLAAVATGLSGALTGSSSIPPELITQVDKATALNRFTNSQRTLRESADGLYDAFKARLRRMERLIQEMAVF